MLILEGLLYTLGAIALSLALSAAFVPPLFRAFERLIWFFTYRFTALSFLVVTPLFLLLGLLLPPISYRRVARRSLVARLQQD